MKYCSRLGGDFESGFGQVAIDSVTPSPLQPRKTIRQNELEELTESIREHGLIQPLIVRRVAGKFELIAGERRLRAATALGLETVPAIARHATDEDMQTLALVENV